MAFFVMEHSRSRIMRTHYSWTLPQVSIALGARTIVMGILNLTPDSFSDGGLYNDRSKAIARALEIEAQGADILDIGGESSRPGSTAISEDEELRRVVPIVEALRGKVHIQFPSIPIVRKLRAVLLRQARRL
jgi:dihydropteroate synthase